MDPSPTPSHNYAGIGTPAYTRALLDRPGGGGFQGRTIRSQTYVPRGTVAHQGFLDLTSYVPGAGRGNEGYETGGGGGANDGDGRDARWEWEYDDQGRPIRTHQAEELIGMRYEDLPRNRQAGRAGIPDPRQPALPIPTGPRRQPSEATQMFRAISQARPADEPVLGSGYLGGWKGLIEPVVGTLGYLGSTLRGRAGLPYDTPNDGQAGVPGGRAEGKDLPGLPMLDGVPLPTKKIPRKPIQTQVVPLATDQEQTGTTRPLARTVRIMHPPVHPSSTPAQGNNIPPTFRGPGEPTWKPRGQIGSILLNTQRLKRSGAGGGQQAVSKFFDTARGDRRGLPAGGQGQTGGARPGGLDKRTISWPLDFRSVWLSLSAHNVETSAEDLCWSPLNDDRSGT